MQVCERQYTVELHLHVGRSHICIIRELITVFKSVHRQEKSLNHWALTCLDVIFTFGTFTWHKLGSKDQKEGARKCRLLNELYLNRVLDSHSTWEHMKDMRHLPVFWRYSRVTAKSIRLPQSLLSRNQEGSMCCHMMRFRLGQWSHYYPSWIILI